MTSNSSVATCVIVMHASVASYFLAVPTKGCQSAVVGSIVWALRRLEAKAMGDDRP